MTSLSSQLLQLTTAASSQLVADRRRASFLFDSKQAATLDRETVLKIGQQGLSELVEIDVDFNVFEANLFADSSQNTERSILSQEGNAVLDANIDRFLLLVTPYWLLSSTHKALEWLVFRYQVHQFNVDALLSSIFPFHETNTFARLLNIVDLHEKHWHWLIPFKKSNSTLSRRYVLTYCTSANFLFVSFVCEQLSRAIRILGESTVSSKLSVLFSFVVSILIGSLQDGSLVDDKLVSKIIPFLASGLRSTSRPYQLTCLMISCQLATIIPLSEAVVQSFLKLMLLKTKLDTMDEIIITAVVICQRQAVAHLPRKAVLKLVHKATQLSLCTSLCRLSKTVQIGPFLRPFLAILLQESTKNCQNLLIEIATDPDLSSSDIEIFFQLILEKIALGNADFSSEFKAAIRNCCLRHSVLFDSIRSEWAVRDEATLKSAIKLCEIPAHELADIEIAKKKRRRGRRSNSRRSESIGLEEDDEHRSRKTGGNGRLAMTSEDNDEKSKQDATIDPYDLMKLPFVPTLEDDPLKEFHSAIQLGQMDKIRLALEQVTQHYLEKQSSESQERFVSSALTFLCEKEKTADKIDLIGHIRTVFSRVSISPQLLCKFLTKFCERRSPKRKLRRTTNEQLDDDDDDDDDDDNNKDNETPTAYWLRVNFLLESTLISPPSDVDSQLVARLFAIVNEWAEIRQIDLYGAIYRAMLLEQQTGDYEYTARLALSLLAKLISSPGKKWQPTKKDIKLEMLIRCIRTARSRRLLHCSLRLLAVVTPIAQVLAIVVHCVLTIFPDLTNITQNQVLAHAMSVFAFMGSGVFRKDDSFSLGAVHETVVALLNALLSGQTNAHSSELLSICRVFAASLQDIPEHRKLDLFVQVVSSAGRQHLWLVVAVLLEHQCLNWQRSDGQSQSTLEKFALDLCSQFSAVQQLDCIRRLLEYMHQIRSDDPIHSKSAIVLPALEHPPTPHPFDRAQDSVKKKRHFRFLLVGWTLTLLSRVDLIAKLAEIDTNELLVELGSIGEELVSMGLVVAQHLNEQLTAAKVESDRKYWKAMTVRGDSLVRKMSCLLPADVTLQQLDGLMSRNSGRIRLCTMHLLNTKLSQQPSPFTKKHVPSLSRLVDSIGQFLLPGNSAELVQVSAYSLKWLVRIMGKHDQSRMEMIFHQCVDMLVNNNDIDPFVLGSVALCIAELLMCLHVKTVVHLPIIVPILLKLLDEQIREKNSELVLLSLVTCLQRMVENLSRFLSPHLSSILIAVCRLSALYSSENHSNCQPAHIVHRLTLLKKRLASIENRVFLHPLVESHQSLTDDPKAVSIWASILSAHVHTISQKELDGNLSDIVDLFFKAFEFRCNFHGHSLSDLNRLEQPILVAFSKLTLRLSENVFRPIMFRLVEWVEVGMAQHANSEERDRVLVGFFICNRLADDLGALFTIFAAQFFAMIPDLLRRCNSRITEKQHRLYANFDGGEKRHLLMCSVFDFIRKCCLQQRFLTKERFTSLIEPIANELDNTKTDHHELRINEHLTPCISRLVIAIDNDLCWKSLNTAILLKSRSCRWKTRLVVLVLIEALHSTLGENSASLMPETVPFLRELAEDDNQHVEEKCKTVVETIRVRLD